MKNKYNILCVSFLSLVSNLLCAQENVLSGYYHASLPSLETSFNELSVGVAVKHNSLLLENPSFYSVMQSEEGSALRDSTKATIAVSGSYGERNGDFLPYEGDASSNFRVEGTGVLNRTKGTLFGYARYARGVDKDYGWNAVRYADIYQPFISTDSCGGDFNYEEYRVEGGYAFRLGRWHLGLNGSFRGEQAYRLTDPRALNNTTWLFVGLGVSRWVGRHLLMLNAGYEKNKQHQVLRYWRPGEQERFFVCNGFGMYDNGESGVLFGYSRMYYRKEARMRLTYQSPSSAPVVAFLSVAGSKSQMDTEESGIENLYFTKTTQIEPSLGVDWNIAHPHKLTIFAEWKHFDRKGFENILERYISDEKNNIYDFRTIDTRHTYNNRRSTLHTKLQYRYGGDTLSGVKLFAGLRLFTRTEDNTAKYRVQNQNISPYAGVGFELKRGKSAWAATLLAGCQRTLKGKYDVDVSNKKVAVLDFQHAFAPYAFYDSEYFFLMARASYLYHLKKVGIGIDLKFSLEDGKRSDETAYSGTIGFESTAPMVTTKPDRHDMKWGSAALFVVF